MFEKRGVGTRQSHDRKKNALQSHPLLNAVLCSEIGETTVRMANGNQLFATSHGQGLGFYAEVHAQTGIRKEKKTMQVSFSFRGKNERDYYAIIRIMFEGDVTISVSDFSAIRKESMSTEDFKRFGKVVEYAQTIANKLEELPDNVLDTLHYDQDTVEAAYGAAPLSIK